MFIFCFNILLNPYNFLTFADEIHYWKCGCGFYHHSGDRFSQHLKVICKKASFHAHITSNHFLSPGNILDLNILKAYHNFSVTETTTFSPNIILI